MKKLIFIFLFIAGTASNLSAQRPSVYRDYYGYYAGMSTTDYLFNYPRPGKSRVVFTFWGVANAGRISLELYNIKQLNHLPNLDSIWLTVRDRLKLLSDSLKEDGVVRRVDYITSNSAPKIRIVNHTEIPKTFTITQGELAEMKVEQDTLRITARALIENNIDVQQPDGTIKKQDIEQPFFIMFTLNNLSDLANLPDSALSICMNRLRRDITVEYVNKAGKWNSYSAAYNMKTDKMFSPSSLKYVNNRGQRQELVPNIYAGVQYAVGSFVPSFAAGLRYTFSNRSYSVKRLYLMWDPYFFFSRGVDNKLVTDRNDFVTLRFIKEENNYKDGVHYVDNASFGYLFYRKGEWFKKNTCKIGLPAVRSGWLQVEPELIFNDFFRNLSPSLKLTLHYE